MRSGMLARSAWMAAACAGLAVGLIAPAALGQSRTDGAASRAASAEGTFDVDFAGGTVGDYFDLLARTARVNIVASDEVRALDIPAVRVRAVNSWAAVHMLESLFAMERDGNVRISDVRAPSEPGLLPTNGGAPASGEPVYVVSYVSRTRGPAPTEAVHEVFSVADVLRPANEEAVESQVRKIFEMIESAMSLAPADAEPELAYHDDSQMLVFRGTPEQRRLVESVMSRYLGSWRPQSAEARALRDDIAKLELQAREATIEAEASGVRLEFLRRIASETRQLVEAGAASSAEQAQSQANLSDHEARMRTLQAQAEYIHTRLEDLRGRLAAITPGEGASVVIYDFRGLGAAGDRLGGAFEALLDAAAIPGTSMQADGRGMVTLRAGPALQEAMRFLLGAVRARADAPAEDPRGGAR